MSDKQTTKWPKMKYKFYNFIMYGGISFINQIDIQLCIGNNSSKTVLNTLQFVKFVDKKSRKTPKQGITLV